MAKRMMQVLAGERHWPPPIWMMRQAGRYLPEYRELRQQAGSFFGLCQDPVRATEVTLQPVRRFGFDAAILFSDILVVPYALGQAVRFEEGEGPRLDPVTTPAAFNALRTNLAAEAFAPTLETVRRVRQALPAQTTLIGFCGAPWTVATYMVAGRGSADQAAARRLAYQEPVLFSAIVGRLVETSITYLAAQLEAGADAVQIFDTWAGVLPDAEFDRWVIRPTRQIVDGVRAAVPGARLIGFPRGAGARLKRYVGDTGVDMVGVDWTADAGFVRAEVQSRLPVQGNLDPLALLAGGPALDAAVDGAIAAFGGGPWVFNLGHGILPETPIAHVERMIARLRASPDPR